MTGHVNNAEAATALEAAMWAVEPGPVGGGYDTFATGVVSTLRLQGLALARVHDLPDWLTGDVIAFLRMREPNGWINVYRSGATSTFYAGSDVADQFAQEQRIYPHDMRVARIDPDGSVHACDGNEVLS